MSHQHHHTGKVFITGAGPGDMGLLTIRAKEVIETADVILYDNLINKKILDLAKPEATKIYAGKIPCGKSVQQQTINEMLVEYALTGKRVVRLKGGDPLIFGRGAEEAAYCIKKNIVVELVPGITSAIAATAYAGIPLTHRDNTQQTLFITGHKKNSSSKGLDYDWQRLADYDGSIVFYMGITHIEDIAQQLIQFGKPATTPVAIIENGTLPDQKTVSGTLEDIAAKAKRENIGTPALIVVGEVVNYHQTLNWKALQPLAGKNILFTQQNIPASLQMKLKEAGAEITHQPFTTTAYLKNNIESIQTINGFDYLLFDKAAGVHGFFNLLYAAGKDARRLNNITIAASGDETASTLLQYGIGADIISADTESLLKKIAVQHHCNHQPTIIIACNNLAENNLTIIDGVEITALPVYENKNNQISDEVAESLSNTAFDYIVFETANDVLHAQETFGLQPWKKICTQTICIAIGKDVKLQLKQVGIQHIVSINQNNTEMIEAVLYNNIQYGKHTMIA